MARINDNGQFELIAALNPGQFDQISVSSEGNEAKKHCSSQRPGTQLPQRADDHSDVLPAKEADEIGRLISTNAMNRVMVAFYDNGKLRVKNPIDTQYANMIMATWQLYSDQREANRLEHRAQMLHEKSEPSAHTPRPQRWPRRRHCTLTFHKPHSGTFGPGKRFPI